jgi:hypothetical protein
MRFLFVQFMLLSKYYLEEAKWCNEKYMPNFKDQVELSSMSSAGPVLTLAALMAAGNEATKEAFEWASSVPDMVHACAEIGRFVNDISGFKVQDIRLARRHDCALQSFSCIIETEPSIRWIWIPRGMCIIAYTTIYLCIHAEREEEQERCC